MEYFFAFLIAFLVSFFVTPLTVRLAKQWHLLDSPTRPHPAIIHTKATPRAGGIPIFFAFFVALTIILIFSSELTVTKGLIGIIVSSMLLVLLGVADDKFDINPYFRLIINFLIVAIVIASGIGISSFTNPFGGTVHLDSIVYNFELNQRFLFLVGEHSIVVLADIVAFFWIIWIMNAMNWSSGVDGQLAGTAVIALSLLGFVSASLLSNDSVQLLPATIAFAGAGAFLGFLPSSFYPQKIMPGYGGAALAGFLIAVLAILSGAKLASVILVILVPLIDSLWAVVRRIMDRRSPVWGDKFHLHHQLLRIGWTIPQICILYYGLTFFFGLLALNLDSEGKFFAIATLGVLTFSILFTIFILLQKLATKKNA